MTETPAREMDAAQAIAAVDSGSTMIDVREQVEWDRGHAPLAKLVPMSALRDRIDEIPVDDTVLVICHSGQRSARVAAALDDAGLDAVSVAGGMIAWQGAGGAVVADGDRPASVD